MCIGQDVRGNIKLSLKATLPKHGSEKKKLEDSDPESSNKKAVNVSVTILDDVPAGTEDDKLSIHRTEGENEGENVENSDCSTPSVIIRSAAECNSQGNANTRCVAKRTASKSLPRPYKPGPTRKQKSCTNRSGTDVLSGQKDINSQTSVANERDSSPMDAHKEEREECMSNKKPKQSSNSKVRANTLKLGDRFTAKVYQIRAHGLVLEVAGGVRGMYKFEVKGRRDFEAGKELQVKCTSFSVKGIPVFSLLEEE